MGLLDDLLSGMGGQAAGAPPIGREPQRRSEGAGMTKVMIALLPVVLAMMAQRRRDPSRTGQGANAGAGLGGLLGSLLGGGGGLGDLLAQFQKAGLGGQAQSWVSRGENQALPPEGLERVFGRDLLAEIARQAGVSEADASRGLSQLLPAVVDDMTPDGKVPDADALVASVEAFARRYGVR